MYPLYIVFPTSFTPLKFEGFDTSLTSDSSSLLSMAFIGGCTLDSSLEHRCMAEDISPSLMSPQDMVRVLVIRNNRSGRWSVCVSRNVSCPREKIGHMKLIKHLAMFFTEKICHMKLVKHLCVYIS